MAFIKVSLRHNNIDERVEGEVVHIYVADIVSFTSNSRFGGSAVTLRDGRTFLVEQSDLALASMIQRASDHRDRNVRVQHS